MKHVLQIAAVLVLAGVLVLGARLFFFGYVVETTTETMNQFTDDLNNLNAARQRKIQASAELQRQARQEDQAKQQRLAALKQQQREFEQQRQRAFYAQYVAPQGCDAPQTERHLIECTNDKMRAKRSFFDSYTNGQ
ncbi:MAG: hypothetical protein ACK5HY_01355 [Parahaliea sp.]